MKSDRIIAAIVVFALGYLAGSSLQPKAVLAQQAAEQKTEWVLEPIQKGQGTNFDAYLYSPRTGEAFVLAERNKVPVKLK